MRIKIRVQYNLSKNRNLVLDTLGSENKKKKGFLHPLF